MVIGTYLFKYFKLIIVRKLSFSFFIVNMFDMKSPDSVLRSFYGDLFLQKLVNFFSHCCFLLRVLGMQSFFCFTFISQLFTISRKALPEVVSFQEFKLKFKLYL